MKKIKTLSVLLSALTAFSGLSITTATATETEETQFAIVDYPKDIIEKPLDEVMYGLTIQYPDGSTEVTDKDSFDYVGVDDFCDTFGQGDFYAYKDSGSTGLNVLGYVYLSEILTIDVSYWDDNEEKYYSDWLEIPFPDDYELPNVFCKDRNVYEKNEDNTLTLKATYGPEYSWDENYNMVYEPLVIPESVYGMTVTAIADYAFLDSGHIEEITIPKTVTSIGEKAFGYCSGNHIHEYSQSLSASPRALEFVEAEDDEEFIFLIYNYKLGDEEYVQYIKDTYLTDCTDLEVDYNEMTGTATKAQILPLIEEEGLDVDLYYSKDSNLDVYLESAMNKATDDTLIPITIYTTATGEVTATKIRRALKSRYFDEDTEFYYDWYEHIYVEATKAQINALKDDEYVTSVVLGDSEFISSDLYYAIHDADWEDTFDIYMTAYGFEDPETYLKISHEAYFDNCEGEFVMVDGVICYVIHGATKQQIIDTSCVDYLYMKLFDEPRISKYNDLTIYGEAGSCAEDYAKANGINFEQPKSEYELGDVNIDGVVSIVDATMVMKANVGLEALTEQQTELADMDGNGIVNVVDATEIQKKLAGL